MMDEIEKKWDNIYREADAQPYEAVRVLAENTHLLPASGEALEIACGMGGNALMLARLGLDTTAWDISSVAIERLDSLAREQGLNLHCTARDILAQPPEPERYDVIIASYFLDRSLFPLIKNALRPQGLLFYQTFTRTRVHESGPRNADFRLADNELLDLCSGMQIIVYREEGRLGDIETGYRDEAMLVAMKN